MFTTVGTRPDNFTLEIVNGIIRQKSRPAGGQTGLQVGQVGSRFVGGQSTNATSFIDVPNSAIDLVTRGGIINAGFLGSPNSFAYVQANMSSASSMTWGLGLRYETDVPSLSEYNLTQIGSGSIQMRLGTPGLFIKKSVPAGAHTFTLMFRGPGAGGGISLEACTFIVWEEF
jgi:hypothetical protein